MKARERVIKAIEHEEPDRVPVDILLRQEVLKKLMKYIGADTEEEVFQFLGVDIRHTGLLPERKFLKKGAFFHQRGKWVIEIEPNLYEDEWGIRYHADKANRYFGFDYYPLADLTNWDNYEFPNINDPTRWQAVKEKIRKFGGEFAIFGIATLTFFEQAWQLRGFNDFARDMYHNQSFVEELLDRLLNYRKVQCKKLAELGVDVIWLGDDFGMQDRMMINPKLWRQYFRPRMQELIDYYGESSEVYTMYHSDGYIEPIIEDLIEIGVDILNPIQPESMDPIKIKETYGHKLTLHGTISVQTTLPEGTVEEVATEVTRIVEACGKGGGLILSPTQIIQPDTDVENILALYNTAERIGKVTAK